MSNGWMQGQLKILFLLPLPGDVGHKYTTVHPNRTNLQEHSFYASPTSGYKNFRSHANEHSVNQFN